MNHQLNHAVARGNIEAVRKLVNAGANINARSQNGLTPLMIAASRGRSNIIRYLVNKGANARTRMSPNNPVTAIHFAAEEGHVNSVRNLMRHSNLQLQDANGRSVLTIAAGLRDPRMLRMLIRAGARPNNATLEYINNHPHNNNVGNKLSRLITELIRWSRAKRTITNNLRAAAMSRRTHAMRSQLGSARVKTGSTYVNGIPVHIRNKIAEYMHRR